MKIDVSYEIIHQICEEVASSLEEFILDNPKNFPCTMACVNFMENLFSEGHEISLDYFEPEVIDAVYKELGESLKS